MVLALNETEIDTVSGGLQFVNVATATYDMGGQSYSTSSATFGGGDFGGSSISWYESCFDRGDGWSSCSVTFY